MHESDAISFSTKELLVEVRNDVRAIHSKLDEKADRGRVHDLAAEVAALRLESTQQAGELRVALAAVTDHGARLDVVESWWDRVSGGLKVSALFFALASALFLYVITKGGM